MTLDQILNKVDIQEAMKNCPWSTSNNARQVIESLQAEVEHHRNGAEPNDDLTMMCLRMG